MIESKIIDQHSLVFRFSPTLSDNNVRMLSKSISACLTVSVLGVVLFILLVHTHFMELTSYPLIIGWRKKWNGDAEFIIHIDIWYNKC